MRITIDRLRLTSSFMSGLMAQKFHNNFKVDLDQRHSLCRPVHIPLKHCTTLLSIDQLIDQFSWVAHIPMTIAITPGDSTAADSSNIAFSNMTGLLIHIAKQSKAKGAIVIVIPSSPPPSSAPPPSYPHLANVVTTIPTPGSLRT